MMRTVVTPWAWQTALFSRLNGRNAPPSPLILHFRHSSTSFSSPKTPRLSMAAAAQSTTQSVSAGDDANVLQLIQSHQEKAARLPPVKEIRTLLDLSVRGTLSTFSQKHEGYPSGSMVDFACDADGSPILAVSSLAVHTKDLTLNPKCSLLVARDPEDRTDLVVTLHGDAIPVPEKDQAAIRTAYLARHPSAFWSSVMRSIKLQKLIQSLNFQSLLQDHAEDTKAIVQHSTSIPVDFAYILDLDSLGFSVKAGYQGENFKLCIPFTRRAEDRKDVKTLIVDMLHAAKPQGS